MQKCILDCIHYVSVQIPIEIYFQPVQVSLIHNGFQCSEKFQIFLKMYCKKGQRVHKYVIHDIEIKSVIELRLIFFNERARCNQASTYRK